MKQVYSIMALIVANLLFSSISLAAKQAPPISKNYPAELISGSTYVIHGPVEFPAKNNQGFTNNPAFVITSEGVVVIDAGGTLQVGEMLIAEIKKHSDLPVVASFSSHVHGDHWLGNQAIRAAFPKAKLYGHPALIQKANDGEAQTWVDLMLEITEGASTGTIAVVPEVAINDGDQIKIGDKTFSIVHKGKAHTETDAMIHVVEDDVYFLGDNTFNGRLGRMDDGSFVGLIQTLDVAIASKAAHYVPGHGQTGDKQVVIGFRTLISTIYDSSRQYYDEGLSDFEMKPLIVKKLQAWQSWPDFDEVIGRFVSFAALEAEEHAFD